MSEIAAPQAVVNKFEGVCPILRVSNLSDSKTYYLNVLGFKFDWEDNGVMISVSRDHCHIMLCQGCQGHFGTWVWVSVQDAEALHTEYISKGAKIRHKPTNYYWAVEMQVEDLDGNVLRFGSAPREGEPEGEWLDMNGDIWTKNPDGGWTKGKRS